MKLCEVHLCHYCRIKLAVTTQALPSPPCLRMWAISFRVLTTVPPQRAVLTPARSAALGLRRPAVGSTTTSSLSAINI